MWIAWALVACTTNSPEEDPEVDTDDVVAESGDETGTVEPPSFNGVPPENPLSLPEFVATNYDGNTRGPGDLIGSPTVLWFYPKAATAG